MPCDPKKIFTDLDVIGVTLTYANIWVAGTKKELASTTTLNVQVFTFKYKNEDFFNVFRYNAPDAIIDPGKLVSAEIRRGTFASGGEDDGTLIEKIEY